MKITPEPLSNSGDKLSKLTEGSRLCLMVTEQELKLKNSTKTEGKNSEYWGSKHIFKETDRR